MKSPQKIGKSGMTLAEVIIALGVVAFVIPAILTATGNASISRITAEADTRSAWLVKEVQQEILAAWSMPARSQVFASSLSFPAFASESSPQILAYDRDGNFLAQGTPQDLSSASVIPNAVYLVAAYSEAYTPANATASDRLAIVKIRVLHPAKSAPAKRSDLRYQFVNPRQGVL